MTVFVADAEALSSTFLAALRLSIERTHDLFGARSTKARLPRSHYRLIESFSMVLEKQKAQFLTVARVRAILLRKSVSVKLRLRRQVSSPLRDVRPKALICDEE